MSIAILAASNSAIERSSNAGAKPAARSSAFWSRSGLLASTRDAGAPPTSPPWGSGDYTTATAIYAAITTALYHRERTGRGANVGTSLLATGVWATGTLVSAALAGAKPYELHDRTAPVNAMTNPYQSGDGRWIMLAARQSAWPTLANAIGRSDLLSDPRFSDVKAIGQHAAELADLLDAEFRSQPLAHWKEVLDAARIPYGVIQSPEEAAADPQLRAADIVVPIEGARDLEYTVNNPITLRGLARVPARRAPEHGEHNDDVLAQLGFSAGDIAQLREQKVIPVAPEQETVL